MKIVAGLVWYCLGSPDAAQRWRAAHVVRDFAWFGRWEIIEQLFALFPSVDGGRFKIAICRSLSFMPGFGF